MTDRPSGEFRLETLLRLAARREEQAAQHLVKLEQAHRRLERQLDALRLLHAEALREGRDTLAAGSASAAWLLQADQYAEALQRRLADQTARVAASTERLDEARAQLLNVSQERRMLEKLKEQQLQRWRAEQDRIEAAELAELGTTRFLRRRAEEAATIR
jgi:flagellar FliJ protein